MKAVAAMRNQFGGHAVRGRRRPRAATPRARRRRAVRAAKKAGAGSAEEPGES